MKFVKANETKLRTVGWGWGVPSENGLEEAREPPSVSQGGPEDSGILRWEGENKTHEPYHTQNIC